MISPTLIFFFLGVTLIAEILFLRYMHQRELKLKRMARKRV